MFWLYFAIGLIVIFALVGGVLGYVLGSTESRAVAVGTASGGVFVGGLIGFLFAIIPTSYAQTHYNERTLTCTVTDKDRGGKEDDMRIYTEECGTLINVDSTWRGKHNSADYWAEIERGGVYEFDVAGWRLGFTSDFPNIFSVKEVQAP